MVSADSATKILPACQISNYFWLEGKPEDPNLLYLPLRDGELGLSSLSRVYKKLQVSKQTQLLTSGDPCIRKINEYQLKTEQTSRKRFFPAVQVRDAMKKGPARARRGLATAAKSEVTKEENKNRLAEIQNLPRQGAGLWAIAVQSIPEKELKFALNATHDTLPQMTPLTPLT